MTYTPHPRRVQVTGDMFHPHLPADTVWAMREAPGHKRSPYANPHPVGDEGPKPKPCPVKACRGAVHDRDEALRLYAEHLDDYPLIVNDAADEMAARFGCRCPLDKACHLDELLRRVDELTARMDAKVNAMMAKTKAKGKIDTSHLNTADDIAIARLALMDVRDRIPGGSAEPGSDAWLQRVCAAEIEAAINFRAVELGLEIAV